MSSLSVIIPAHGSPRVLELLLDTIAAGTRTPEETIVVDDACPEGSGDAAAARGARVIRNPQALGPAAARNIGVEASRGDIIIFLDSDVTVSPATIASLAAPIEAGCADAVIGSYDDSPNHPGLLSQYRNLLHAWVHRNANRDASTFWGACGSVRRDAFLAAGGYPLHYGRPAIEDIEFGALLKDAGFRILLDPEAQVCHWKEWTLLKMVRTDLFDRAIPWTRLILRRGKMPDDLNVKRGERLTGVLSLFIPLTLALTPLYPALAAGALAALLLFVYRNRAFYGYLAGRKGWFFVTKIIPFHILFYWYSCLGFALGVAGHMLGGEADRSTQPAGPEEMGK